MSNFIISYDVRAKNHDYKPLYQFLDNLGAIPFLYSVRLLSRNTTASAIRDGMKNHMHADDTIGVIELPSPLGGWATRNIEEDAKHWLNNH